MKIKIAIAFLAMACSAADAQVSYGVNYIPLNITAYVAPSPNASGDIVISPIYYDPSTTNYYPVTSIGLQAFENCTNLTSVTIPDSVWNISIEAFQNCNSLTSITIPNSVTKIGQQAFHGCVSLTNVTIPNSVTNIDIATFVICSNLTCVAIPNSVTSIRNFAFELCASLTNITFLGNAPTLGSGVFSGINANAVVYYYHGTSGWGTNYGGLPTVELFRSQISGGGVDRQSGQFRFTISGVSNQTIVVEATTDVVNWQPIWTNILADTNVIFIDPQWTNYSKRFYRAR